MGSRLAVAGLLLITLNGPSAGAQSLAQLAQEEADRRRAITAPARVITKDDLPPTTPPAARRAPAVPVDEEGPFARRVPLTPATLEAAVLPRIPFEAVGGGEVVLELTVDQTGRVISTTTLRDTPPFTAEMAAVVRGWQFKPAEDAAAPATGSPVDRSTSRPITSQVLVIGLFRPPALFPFTLGQPPATLAAPSDGVAVPRRFPSMPVYPPQALFDGVVLTELSVTADGVTDEMRVLRSAPAFDQPTLDVLRGLTFRPARVYGQATPATVYVVTAFRQPVTP